MIQMIQLNLIAEHVTYQKGYPTRLSGRNNITYYHVVSYSHIVYNRIEFYNWSNSLIYKEIKGMQIVALQKAS